jgi:uncharacterized protein YndB with AHSA1/START domain
MTGSNNIAVLTRERELVMTRVFDSPQDLVFEVWIEPKHLANWLVPSGFSLAFCQLDFREGGDFKFCMRSPEGEDRWFWGTYSEIVEPERIVFTMDHDAPDGTQQKKSIVTVTFEAVGEKTKLTLSQGVFEFEDDHTERRREWSECLDRLAQYVEKA